MIMRYKNFYAIICIFLITVLLASFLGLEYSPINDAWHSILAAKDTGFFNWIDRVTSGSITSRETRLFPFSLQAEFGANNFNILKICLFINFFTTYIFVFLLIGRLLTNRLPSQFFIATLFMLFPFDGTAFWLGAFGVNYALLFATISVYLLTYAIEKYSIILLLLSALFGALSLTSHPSVILIYGFLCATIFIKFTSNLKLSCIFLCIFSSIIALPIFILLIEFMDGGQRNKAVQDLNYGGVFKGYANATKGIFIDAPINILLPEKRNILIATISATLITFILFKFEGPSDSLLKKPHSISIFKTTKVYKIIFESNYGFVFFAIVIFVVGYLPYSLSTVRFGLERQLMYSRLSLILILTLLFKLGTQLQKKELVLSKKHTIPLMIIFLSLIIQEKLKVAEEYSSQSKTVMTFMERLNKFVPNIESDQNLIILFEDPENIKQKAAVLINRPHLPISMQYNRTYKTHIKAKGTTLFLLTRNLKHGETVSEIKTRFKYNPKNDITLFYHTRTGFRPMTEINMDYKRKKIIIANLPGIKNRK